MIKTISRKLRDRSGASILIAMVFMLFCLFVGGSVLAAATANGYRVKNLSDQQAFLNQRSAALLVADELKTADGSPLELFVYDDRTSKQKIVVGNGGAWRPDGSPPVQGRTIRFKVPAGTTLSDFQRIMVEMTIWNYLKETAGTSAILEYNGLEINLSDFSYKYDLNGGDPLQGSIGVSLKKDGAVEDLVAFDARYTEGRGADQYDFMVDFGGESQLKLRMDAVCGASSPVVTNVFQREGSNDFRVTTTSTRTVISWQQPNIEKGGAD